MGPKSGNKLYHLLPENTLFMLCDLQEKFKPAIPCFDAIVKNTKNLIAAGKIFNVPLFVTEQYPEKLGATVSELDIKHACTVVPKTRFSMMVPPITKKMQDIFVTKPKTVVLCGVETHICIEQTAFELINEEIDVWLVADCCGSRLPYDRNLALERLRSIGCNISTKESVIFNMLRNKNHESFKEIAGLVKKVSDDTKL